MRIDKTIKGEIFSYHVYFIPNKMKATVKQYFNEEGVIGDITEDFKYIILPETFLSPYITGYGYIKVKKLKLNKQAIEDAKDYNNIK